MFDAIQKNSPHLINKVLRDKNIGFRECSYCNKESNSNHEVNAHMELDHRQCAFQCMHCFYRCNEMDYIVLHYETFHKDKPCEILLCNEKREFEFKDLELLQNDCAEYIKKFTCGQGKEIYK